MEKKKGYGLVIPANWKSGKWDKLTIQEIVNQLRVLNRDTFYRMAAAVDIDLALLAQSGYVYDGLSEVAKKELEAFVPKRKFSEVRKLLSEADFQKHHDFQFVFHLYNDRNSTVAELYMPEIAAEIMKSRGYSLRDERENVRNLMALFIDEFEDDKTAARRKMLKKYGGYFISMPEFDSFLSYRDIVEWFRGDTFDPSFEENVKQMRAMRELGALYKLLSNGGSFQIQSSQLKHQKISISQESSELLANSIALTLKMLYDTDPMLSPDLQIDKKYHSYDLITSSKTEVVDEILDAVNIGIENYEDEFDLSLFYYLADNAINWPNDITQTKRYLFLYRLAKFFKHISELEYEDTESSVTRKEIVDSIKFRIKQMRKKDANGETLKFYLHPEDL